MLQKKGWEILQPVQGHNTEKKERKTETSVRGGKKGREGSWWKERERAGDGELNVTE